MYVFVCARLDDGNTYANKYTHICINKHTLYYMCMIGYKPITRRMTTHMCRFVLHVAKGTLSARTHVYDLSMKAVHLL